MDLRGIQWLNFKNTYEQGLKDLLIALSTIELKVITVPKIESDQAQISSDDEPVLVVPQPAPSPPNPDLMHLYREGIAAKAANNLERTAIQWQQVLDRDLSFGNSILVSEMKKLMQELHPIRIRRLRERAEKAHHTGEWGQENWFLESLTWARTGRCSGNRAYTDCRA